MDAARCLTSNRKQKKYDILTFFWDTATLEELSIPKPAEPLAECCYRTISVPHVSTKRISTSLPGIMPTATKPTASSAHKFLLSEYSERNRKTSYRPSK